MGIKTYTIESLKESGWTCAGMPVYDSGKSEERNQWCRANCAWDEWVHFGWDYWFADPNVATLFVLRWT